MDDEEWLRKLIEEFVPNQEDSSFEEIANDLRDAIFKTDRSNILYQNWSRLMEMEARWASEADPNYAIPVTPLPSELAELLPLFLSRENISDFIQSHFTKCKNCNEPVFLSFHISPTMPFEDVGEKQIERWLDGKKRVSVQQSCSECGEENSDMIPPAIPPEAWHQWWFEIGEVLQDTISEKIRESRRFETVNIEKGVELEVPDEQYDSLYHIPVIATEIDESRIAIDLVRSPFFPRNIIRETYHHFHAVCEKNDIQEKLFIVVGTFPKSFHDEFLSLKEEYLRDQFNKKSMYRNLYFHTISYPEELDLVLNQMSYGHHLEGTSEGPSIYEINNWERKLMGLGSGEDNQEERQVTKEKLAAMRGPLFEQTVKEYLESIGYTISKSDELDAKKVDILAHKEQEETEEFRLIQCKAGTMSIKKIDEVQNNFENVEEKIRSFRELFVEDIQIRHELFLGKADNDTKKTLEKAGFQVKTKEDIPKDEIDPRQRDLLHFI